VTAVRAFEAGESSALWARYRATGDPVARARLLEAHLGLVHHAARELTRRGLHTIDHDELVSAGTVGLVHALEGFDPKRGQAFSSYAMPRIRGAILDELRALDWRSRGGRARARRLDHVHAGLAQRLGREPSPDEVAAELGVDLDTYWRWRDERAAGPPVTLHVVRGGADAESRGAIAEELADPGTPDPADRVERDETRAALRDAFTALSEKDRLVLALSFEEGLTLREIAQLLHVTESRVSQLRTRALARLRGAIAPPREEAA